MKQFAALFQALDATTAQSAKLAALVAYLRVAAPGDAAWAVYFLAGGKPRQMVPTKRLKALAQQAAGLPEWLFDESYEAVGDLAETIALLLPPPAAPADVPLADPPPPVFLRNRFGFFNPSKFFLDWFADFSRFLYLADVRPYVCFIEWFSLVSYR